MRASALGGGRPGRPWETLVLAHATLLHDEAAAMRDYAAAAEDFASQGDAEGEVIAAEPAVVVAKRGRRRGRPGRSGWRWRRQPRRANL
ncbi:MAG: hypothetical protein R2712_03340 [Vicinamibacterales bacterium]